MLRFALILALMGLLSAPAFAADPAPAAAAAPAAMDNLGGKGKPCPNHQGGPGMMMKGDKPCHNKMGGGCDCKRHAEMSDRMHQLEKRVDALQMALEAMAKR